MTSLFSQEHVTKTYGEEKLRQGRIEGRAEGLAEGESKGEEKNARESAFRMRDMGFEDSVIAQVVNVSLSKLQSWFADSPTSMPQT